MNSNQKIRMDGHISDPLAVLLGVPQGSVMGPLLFLVYINDTTTVHLKLFADDYLIVR